jgi:hypothetical protein
VAGSEEGPVSNGDRKVLRFPVERAGNAPARTDPASPETLARGIAELARSHPALKATAERLLAAIKDPRNCSWEEEVARAAAHMIEAYGSAEQAIATARRLEETSELPAFARAVRAELERRAAGKV